MKGRAITCLLAISILLVGCHSERATNEYQLMEEFFELAHAVQQLFQYHETTGTYYYNEHFQSVEDVSLLLEEKVTETGFDTIVDSIFQENDGRLIYQETYQSYLEKSNRRSGVVFHTGDYYETVRETLLNPAMLMLHPDDFVLLEDSEGIQLVAEDVRIVFYEEENREVVPYTRYGYPPYDVLTVEISFVFDRGQYRVEHFRIQEGQEIASS